MREHIGREQSGRIQQREQRGVDGEGCVRVFRQWWLARLPPVLASIVVVVVVVVVVVMGGKEGAG